MTILYAMKIDFTKLPRLYTDAPLKDGGDVVLTHDQVHYLKNVLRRSEGQPVRMFNERDGEWVCTLKVLSKKIGLADIDQNMREPEPAGRDIHLFFAPIKKTRMDWLIEKSVELGVTHLHPVLTQNTEVREINMDRITQQILEAAEQCERLNIPTLHKPIRLQNIPGAFPEMKILACVERLDDAQPIRACIADGGGAVACLIGPEGGFTEKEATWITARPEFTPVSLGSTILRAETAAIAVLSRIMLS